jgi:hypothetical protein
MQFLKPTRNQLALLSMSNDFIGHGMQRDHLLMQIPKATIAHLSLKFMADES